MVINAENVLFIGSILLLISIFAGKTSYKFGVPTLLFFLGVGMLAGSEGIGGIYFDDPNLAQFVGIMAFNFILFTGGFETDFKQIKPVLSQGLILSTAGVLLTAVSLGLFVFWITDYFTIYESLLLGSIVSSTDAAAVFSILRSKKMGLKNNLRPLLELESGSNDPMANVLTIVFTGLVVNQDNSLVGEIPFLFQQIIIGALMGLALGFLSKRIINKISLDFDGLYPVLVIALLLFTYSSTTFLSGNGFLAVYITGIYLGNQELMHKKTILRAFDGFSWLMQIVLFLTLGLLVYPSELLEVAGIGLIISLFLIFVARPISVFSTLAFFKTKTRNKWFISWVGLRGAVPIVFATYPLVAGIEKANLIFNIVFFISITSLLIQGTTLSFMAKVFHVNLPEKVKKYKRLDTEFSEKARKEFAELTIESASPWANKKIIDLGLANKALITMIKRGDSYITPNGGTILLAGDLVYIIADDKESLEDYIG